VLGLPEGVAACLFDLDGVLTDTAKVHAAAWKEMFDGFLRERAAKTDERFVPFDPVADYHEYVDGKPRSDGVRSLLAARGTARDHLDGKPAPDTFLAGARALRVAPDRAAVFEDALAGVAAGRAGGFAYAVGVDRVGQAEELRTHGADVVVSDLAELLES
jgi:beta-phosphoglucomutase-like phosphatase (HAD superfamily)